MDSTTGDSGSSSSKARREDEEFQEFLKMLQAQFKGRRCYLGLYDLHPRSSASSGASVGSVMVTLEPPRKLSLGAFLRRGRGGVGGWEFWEGTFGPSDLAEHRETLGWEGHGLDALKTCFTGAIDRGGTLQPRPPPGENAPAATDGNYCGTSGRNAAGLEAGSKAAELQLGENAAGSKPSRGSLAEVHPGAAETSDDEHKQRPPEFSLASDAEDAGGVTGIVGAVGAVEGGEDGDVRADGGGAAATAAAGASTATGTLDLHYADPGIVGPWAMRRVQGGLCDGLVDSMQRGIMAAYAVPSTDTVQESPSKAKAASSSARLSGKRRRGGGAVFSQRRRMPATGATLLNSQLP